MSDGTCAIVTGAASGIGLAIAREFAKNAFHVIMLDRDADLLSKVAQTVPGSLAVSCDVANRSDQRRAIDLALDRTGAIDVLVNNAGINQSHSVEEVTAQLVDDLIAVNFRAPFELMQMCLPHMSSGSSIINIASINGIVGQPNKSVYSGTKGGLIAMTRAWAIEFAPRGIRVNCIAPGGVRTRMHEDFIAQFPAEQRAEAEREVASHNPLNRVADPSEVAALAGFLASQAASYMTGSIVTCDGGETAD